MRASLCIAAFALSGCQIVGHERVVGWPDLRITEHHVPHKVMRDKCAPGAPVGMSPEACAYFNLRAGTCDIYLSADFPPPAYIIAHEREHCAGFDHIGSTYMRDLLARFRGAKK